MKKILIVGGVAGGASAAARLRRLNEEDKIILFEKGPHVSFSNCSLPYYVGGLIPSEETLLLMSPEKFLKQFNVDARVNSEVIAIDREKKEVTVISEGKEYKESYDKLILSMGAKPIVPPIKGIEKVNIFTVRNVVDIAKIHSFLGGKKNAKVAVIGGGFIGIEMAENIKEAGHDVTIIEALPQIMKPFDYDMVYCSRTNVLHCDKNCKEIFKTKDYEGNSILGVKFLDTLNIVEDNTFRYAYCNVCFNDELYEHIHLIIKRNNEINKFREYVYVELRGKINTNYLNIHEFNDFCNYIEDRTNRERIYKISIEYNIFRGGYDDFEKKIMFK